MPGAAGQHQPVEPAGAPPRISNGASTPPDVPDASATSQIAAFDQQEPDRLVAHDVARQQIAR